MNSKATAGNNPLQIRAFFETLYSAWGPQHWWPADSQFEVIVGAVLTQNTAWKNVEKAMANLRSANALSMEGFRNTAAADLEPMIRPAGYFRQKTARLKEFVRWIDIRFNGSLGQMFKTPTAGLRAELLQIKGIGPETADSILLYAGQHEVFVVDAYTRRILQRHGLITGSERYDPIRAKIENVLKGSTVPRNPTPTWKNSSRVEPGPGPAVEVLTPMVHSPSRMSECPRTELAQRYNEFHALLVQVAKHYCQSQVARCESCPLRVFLESGKPVTVSKARTGAAG